MNETSNKPESGGFSAKEAAFTELPKVTIPSVRRTPESIVLSVLQRYDAYVALANQKASFLMGASGLVLVAAVAKRSKLLTGTEIAYVTWLNDVLYLIAGLGLFGVLICSLAIILPITRTGAKHGEYTSFIAYSSVAKMDVETFRSKLSSTDYDFWNDLVRQTHQLAKITADKFEILKWASWLALISTVLIAILFLIVAFK